MGYEIGVSYSGLTQLTSAARDVAECFSAAQVKMAHRSLPASSTTTSELGDAVLRAAQAAMATAAHTTSSLADSVSQAGVEYGRNEQLTASQLASGAAKTADGPR